MKIRLFSARPRLLVIVGLMLLVRPSIAAIPEPVRVEQGLVSGVAGASAGVRVFKGIPFAAAPVGERRWRAPEPPTPWAGVRAADKLSANCMQRAANGGAFPPYGGDRSATTMSEDCLYLNVYTAAASAGAKQPVMVWIHGGAWTSGAGGIYLGEDLARKGVVVVTVNYRLGVFGFLAHPELTKESAHHSSGNYALLDQIAALRWVKTNIAAFGGDPSRVTIFGESAGSWSVHNLVGSPLAKGLIHRALGQSGARFSITTTLAEAEATGLKFAESIGAPKLAALRAKSADDLLAAAGFQSVSNADGWVLPATMAEIFAAGKQNDVPVLIGFNRDEGSIFTSESATVDSLKENVRRRFGQDADAVLKLYPAASDQEARRAQANMMRDQTFGWEMRTWARMQQTGKSKVFLYYFTQVPPLPNAEWLGAQHGAEIPYAMNWPNGGQATNVPWTEADRKFAEQVSSYWVNFAATGDPNGKGLPAWPAYSRASERAFELGPSIGPIPIPNAAALDLIETRARLAQPTAAAR